MVSISLKLRFCKFVKDILLRGSNLIKHIAAMAQHTPFSVYSNNCNDLADKYGANFDVCTYRILIEWNNSINEIDVSNVNVLKDMIDIRDGGMVCVTLSREDTLHIIDGVCLNQLLLFSPIIFSKLLFMYCHCIAT